ncbi:thioredoxin-disulfide reductase [Treponema sp. Marseille-Q4132]|uniref:thioredoxin-disulfide reductase n=1 Tax=Treponema sp. Marseille-Q4132 TaxID=2766701 RepID=UPI0016530618|nr:thioredoxin-disulfide reductase [Treponema sp. Marseille-Q4132]QNL96815.1 thioredoxin-disulfide reductase [Treponema sp. Marseille-Q4132]
METISCDYIIVGAGSAGLASAQYAARAGLRTVVFDPLGPGGQVLQIFDLENYPGVFPAVTGSDFIDTMKKQAESFGARIVQAKIDSIDKIKNTFYVHTEIGEYSSFALLIATGAEHRMLGVPGEKELTGRGVSYCATCDGPFFRNKTVIVVGGGDSACTEALYLASISPHITLVHRKAQFRAQYAVVEKVKNDKNINVKYNTVVKEIRGNGRVQSVLLEDTETGDETDLPADAVFIFVGMKARTELFDTLPKDGAGYIVTNEKMETIVPGLYCAGDVRAKPFRQIVTAVSDGAIAAHEAAEYVKSISPSGDRA